MSDLSEAASEKLAGGTESEGPKKRGRKPLPRDAEGNIIRPSAPEADGETFVYKKDENSVKASAAMGMMVWFLASKMLPVRELTEEEGMQLGESLDPVLCKWMPMLGAWMYEANLLFCIIMLYMATKIEKGPKEVPAESGEVDATRTATG
jgi:hypothetical protein